MKIIINSCFGGFGVNANILKKYDIQMSNKEDLRTNKKLIELIESGVNCDTSYSHLIVEKIPDEATDYYIEEYDGVETVLYVLDGKIIFA